MMKQRWSTARLVPAILTAWALLYVWQRGAPAQSPTNSAAQPGIGRSQLAQDLNHEAMKSFEAVLQTDPHNAEAREGEVKAAVTAALQAKLAGDNDGALVYLVRARKYVPDDPGLLFDFGVQADAMRLYKDAEEALNKALELRPADAQIVYALGHLELDEGKMPRLKLTCANTSKCVLTTLRRTMVLAILLHVVARNEEAKAELRRSIELSPRQTESYHELGDIELNLEHDDEAAALFQKVLGRNRSTEAH